MYCKNALFSSLFRFRGQQILIWCCLFVFINLPRQSVFQIILYWYWKWINALETLLSHKEILPDSKWKLSLSCKDEVSMKAFLGSSGNSKNEHLREVSCLGEAWCMLTVGHVFCIVFHCILWIPGIHLTLLAGVNCLSSVCTSRQHTDVFGCSLIL